MLLAYRDWLAGNRPDPTLAERVMLRGTPGWRSLRDDLAALQSARLRATAPGSRYVVRATAGGHPGDDRVIIRNPARSTVLVSRDGSTRRSWRAHHADSEAVADLTAVAGGWRFAYVVPIGHRPGDSGRLLPPPSGTAAHGASPDDGRIGQGPHGGTLTVGLTVSIDGSPGVPADSPDAPSPYRVVATPARDTTSPLAGLCNPGNGTIWGWTWRVQVIDTATGAVVSDEPECVAFSQADGPPGPGPVGATPPTIGEIWRSAHIPLPPLGLSPPDDGVTGLATWMWSSSPDTVSIAATLDGWTVRGVAHRSTFLFDPGDGGAVERSRGGRAADPTLAHTYERKGTYRVAVGTIWTATVAMTGPGVDARPTSIGSAWLTVSADYPVIEVRSNLTG